MGKQVTFHARAIELYFPYGRGQRKKTTEIQ